MMVAALYVEADGAYTGLPHVDAWDIGRDARQYAGPHPVVAHVRRCKAMFGHVETDTYCDWSPSRFERPRTLESVGSPDHG